MGDLYFLISWLSNTFFVFVTIALIVQGLLSLFKVGNYRLRASARMLPLLALTLTPFIDAGKYLNPLSCGGWLQKALVYFYPHLYDYLADLRMALIEYSETHAFALNVLLGVFIAITLIKVTYKLLLVIFTAAHLKQLVNSARPSAQNAALLVSDAIHTPMAVGLQTILIPAKLLELLNKEELAAVVAHELAHLRYGDPLVRLFNHLLKSIFWWIPLKGWIKLIADEQEIACDQCAQEGIASALVKSVRYARQESALLCGFMDKPHFILVRLNMLAGTPLQEHFLWKGAVPLITGPLILLSCVA